MAGNYKHGQYGTKTYRSWAEMKYRCKYPHNAHGCYKGISVCDRWKSFENFYADMGDRPDGTSIDRINPRGNYEPSNCRWATIETQENNKTTSVYYVVDGEKLSLTQIARKFEVSRSNLANKIYLYHMDMNDAIAYLLKKKEG